MKTKVNIHLIPTNKESRLWRNDDNTLEIYNYPQPQYFPGRPGPPRWICPARRYCLSPGTPACCRGASPDLHPHGPAFSC